jgi:DNA-binding MarR family transcriptional regulator
MTATLPSLDALLHQPARTQLIAFLSGRGEATFSELKRVLDITDGNLGAHLGKLVEAGYVGSSAAGSASGRGEGGRSQTVYHLTPVGRAALAEYVAHLTALMALSGAEAAPDEILPPTAAKPA